MADQAIDDTQKLKPVSPMTPDERYAALVDSFGDHAIVTLGAPGKKGFGSSALQFNGKIFAMLSRDRLVVKLPRQRVATLAAAGEGEPFDPGHGRLMTEWFSLFATSAMSWRDLADEALAFAATKQ